MLLARVVGTVVSSQKESSMEGLRFMLVQPVDMDSNATGTPVVAVDAVGAGTGEYILYAAGSSARQTRMTDKRPCDAWTTGRWAVRSSTTRVNPSGGVNSGIPRRSLGRLRQEFLQCPN